MKSWKIKSKNKEFYFNFKINNFDFKKSLIFNITNIQNLFRETMQAARSHKIYVNLYYSLFIFYFLSTYYFIIYNINNNLLYNTDLNLKSTNPHHYSYHIYPIEYQSNHEFNGNMFIIISIIINSKLPISKNCINLIILTILFLKNTNPKSHSFSIILLFLISPGFNFHLFSQLLLFLTVKITKVNTKIQS